MSRHIGFDVSQTGVGKAGCGFYAQGLIKAMLELAPEHRYSIFPSFGDFYFDARLGNLEITRDWGYAGDFVRAMWVILQQERPDDYVIGTGKLHTLKQLCEIAYGSVDKDWWDFVVSDPALVRPLESGQSLADSSKARLQLGWEPTVSFDEMIGNMVRAQLQHLSAAIAATASAN
jgi:hypothetical protein